ncbi:MFS transporter [Planomonospora sphaerica]|uniref:MFS transporter n=1 Tax=Planomonospora sphaerica TaxID=161355 RepID=A0A171DIS1_9ACTN|nr:MFS transporter [Planomonospora sphaerica]GAT68781.1 MFS transporter [Planomonospora sphaerica]
MTALPVRRTGTPGQSGSAARQRAGLARLRIVLFAIAGLNGAHTAVLPFLPHVATHLGLSPLLLGVFLLADPAAKALCQPLGGALTDRAGPGRILPLGLVIAVAGIAVVMVADQAHLAIGGRLIWGAGTGIAVPAAYRTIAVLAETYQVPPARLYASFGAGAITSMAAGPPLAGLLAPFTGYQGVLAIAAAIGLAGAALVVVRLRLPVPPRASAPGTGPAERPALRPGDLRAVIVFGVCSLCCNLAWSSVESLVPLSLGAGAHDSTGASALVLTAGLVSFIAVTLALGRLPDGARSPRAGSAAAIIMGGAGIALVNVDALGIGLPAIVIFMGAQAWTYLAARDGMTHHTGRSGKAFGVFGMIADGGNLLGPLVVVLAAGPLGPRAAFALLGAVCLVAAATLAIGTRILPPVPAPASFPEAGAGAGGRHRAPRLQPAPVTTGAALGRPSATRPDRAASVSPPPPPELVYLLDRVDAVLLLADRYLQPGPHLPGHSPGPAHPRLHPSRRSVRTGAPRIPHRSTR